MSPAVLALALPLTLGGDLPPLVGGRQRKRHRCTCACARCEAYRRVSPEWQAAEAKRARRRARRLAEAHR